MNYMERRHQRMQEEEKREKRLKRRNSRMSWLMCLIGIALLFFYKVNMSTVAAKETKSSTSAASVQTASVPSVAASSDSDSAQKTAALAADWRLILVNRSSPLPTDFAVALTTRKDGSRVDERIEAELEEMFRAAQNDDVALKVCSAYRSVSQQKQLYHAESFASGIPVSVQPAGESEHHTGLALDIVTTSYQTLDSGFVKTPAYAWLQKNSWEYGFVLRYPKDKEKITGVIYEPWHFRYVGKDYAKVMNEKQMCLEEYRQSLGI